jgi:hypothetical protein
LQDKAEDLLEKMKVAENLSRSGFHNPAQVLINELSERFQEISEKLAALDLEGR